MKAAKYLGRALQLDRQIDCKLDQIARLRSLTQRVTSSYDNIGPSHSQGNSSSMENAIIRLMEAQDELNSQIAALIDVKAEIQKTVQQVSNERLRLLLEKRYLCCMTWEAIAVDMECSYRWLMTLHNEALEAVDKLLEGGCREE